MEPVSADVLAARRLLLVHASSRCDVQRSAIERVEVKAGIVLGLAVTASQFLASRHVTSPYRSWALGCYALAMVGGLFVTALRPHKEINLTKAIPKLRDIPEQAVIGHLLAEYTLNFGKNQARSIWRARVWWMSVGALLAAAVLSVVHLTQGKLTP